REGLLEAARVGRDVRDHEADEDRAAVERLLGEELAAAVLELADRGRAQGAARAVREVEAPLARLRVVEAQAQALDVALRAFDLELHEVRAAVPHRTDHRGARVLDPGRRARERMHPPSEVRLPGTDLEVEVVRTVAPRRRGLRDPRRGAR